MVFQKTRKLWVWCAMAFALVMFLGALAGCASASGGEFAFARWNVLASR